MGRARGFSVSRVAPRIAASLVISTQPLPTYYPTKTPAQNRKQITTKPPRRKSAKPIKNHRKCVQLNTHSPKNYTENTTKPPAVGKPDPLPVESRTPAERIRGLTPYRGISELTPYRGISG